MSMADFAQLRRQRRDVPLDLVVLSACRTMLGDQDSELGFAGLALQAGARSAIGTNTLPLGIAVEVEAIVKVRPA